MGAGKGKMVLEDNRQLEQVVELGSDVCLVPLKIDWELYSLVFFFCYLRLFSRICHKLGKN